MGTTQADIRGWLKDAKKKGATHLLVVCDGFDHEDYPVFIMPGQNAKAVAEKEYSGVDMQHVMECYSLAGDIEAQLNEHRAFHWE